MCNFSMNEHRVLSGEPFALGRSRNSFKNGKIERWSHVEIICLVVS